MSDSFSDHKKDAGGRPSNYKEEYVQEIVTFFEERELFREEIEKKVTKEGELIEVPVKQVNGPPTYAGFAKKIGVCLDTLKNWTRAHPEFNAAYEKCRAIQAEHIIQINMENKGNTAFSIFMMKNNHGWTDKVESKVETNVKLENLVENSFEGPEGEKQ